MKKKIIALIAAAALIITSAVAFSGCGAKEKLKIAIPNDTTNEARALLLLEDLGYIKLKDGAGITATPKDIKDNPHNIEFKEVEAAQVPNVSFQHVYRFRSFAGGKVFRRLYDKVQKVLIRNLDKGW